MFAATPPLEATNMLFSMAMTRFANGRASNFSGTQKLLFIDVRRAYFYAPSRRPVFVALPPGDEKEGYCGRLNVSCMDTVTPPAIGRTKMRHTSRPTDLHKVMPHHAYSTTKLEEFEW